MLREITLKLFVDEDMNIRALDVTSKIPELALTSENLIHVLVCLLNNMVKVGHSQEAVDDMLDELGIEVE
jgi:hypothetical protein